MNPLLEQRLKEGNTIHHSCRWPLDGSRRIHEMNISASDDGPNRYHYVFQLNANLLRRRATNFSQFKKTDAGRQMRTVFHWFLDFMREMVSCQEKKTPLRSGHRTLAFLEWCETPQSTNEKIKTAGYRFHVFVDRDMNEMGVFRAYLDKIKKEHAKLKSKKIEPPAHFGINTCGQYGSRIYEPYKGDVCNFEELYDVDHTNPEASPSNLFRMTEMQNAVHNMDDYYRDGGFGFPTVNFMKLDTESICFEEYAYRKLPDFALHSLAKPEIRILRLEDDIEVIFPPHRSHKDYGEDPTYKPSEDWEDQGLQKLIHDKADTHMIWAEGRLCEVGAFGDITYSKKLHRGSGMLKILNPDELTGKAQALYVQKLQRQAAHSELDLIEIEAVEKSEKQEFATRKAKFDFVSEEYLTRVWNDPDAFVSDPIKSCIQWFQREYLIGKRLEPYDLTFPGHSVFAHRAFNCSMIYHTLYQVASAHRECYWLLVARNDAFRHEHKLHLNAMFVVDAATSKSFLQTTLETNSVGYTTKKLTYQTSKAGAVDHDDNHHVRLFDETPAAFLKDEKNKVDEPALKMKLVEQLVSHERPFIDPETGARKKETGLSSCIDVIIGASNESKLAFSDALKTRFHFFESIRCMAEREVRDCINALKTMAREQKDRQHMEIIYHQFEQFYCCQVWQFIRMGAIAKPDTSILNLVMKRFGNELSKYGINMDTREWSRVEILAMNLSILRAKEILYMTKTGKYVSVDFHPSQIWDAEPLLICTEEIVLHAIGLEFDSVVSPSIAKVLPTIWKMHLANPEYRMNGVDTDYNYICLNGTVRSISKKIFNALQQDKKHASLVNIEACLKEMEKDLQIKSLNYKQGGSAKKYNDLHPENDLGDTNMVPNDQLKIVGNKMYIHIHMFDSCRLGKEDNIYKNIVESLTHKFTAKKKIVLGTNLPAEPQFWDTVQYEPHDDPNRVINQRQGPERQHSAWGSRLGYQEDCSDVIIEEDLDIYAARQRSSKTKRHVEPYEPNPADWSHQLYGYPLRKLDGRLPLKRTHEVI